MAGVVEVGEALAVTEAVDTVDSAGDTAELRLERSFDAEFPALFRGAYRVAYRLSGSREEAADCAQEACARAYADWKRLVRRGDVTPWVVRVSGNLAIDRWRNLQRARRVPAAAAVAEPTSDRLDLSRALDALPRRQREVIVLRYIADMSEAAVAEALGCSLGTVKTHASRALAALRRTLEPREEAQP